MFFGLYYKRVIELIEFSLPDFLGTLYIKVPCKKLIQKFHVPICTQFHGLVSIQELFKKTCSRMLYGEVLEPMTRTIPSNFVTVYRGIRIILLFHQYRYLISPYVYNALPVELIEFHPSNVEFECHE